MVARTPTGLKNDEITYRMWGVYSAEVSQSDTIELTDFDSSKDLDNIFIVKQTDGTELTGTIALNVITITGSATNVDVIIFAVGVKA